MTHDDRSLERAARTWIEAGPTQAPDRAVDAALTRIQTTTQERDLRIPWRLPTVFNNRIVLVAAALVVVVAGAFTFSRFSAVGQVVATPTVAPTTVPITPNPSPTSINLAAGYTDLTGWIVFEHFGNPPDGSNPTFNGDYRAIWLVHADGTGLHELAPGKPAAGKVSPDVSPDGSKVVFSSWEETSKLYEATINGATVTELRGPCAGQPKCAASDPVYSADGKRVAYVERRDSAKGGTFAIAILDLATATTTVLTGTQVDGSQGFLSQPSWAPDGTRIVYTVNTQKSTDEHITNAQLVIAQVGSSATARLPQPPGNFAADADWSPDGSTIVFSSFPNREGEGWADGAPATGIYGIHPDGTGLHSISAAGIGGGIAPSWTPDGKHIMFWEHRTWAVMNPDGTEAADINQAKLTWFGGALGYGYYGLLAPSP